MVKPVVHIVTTGLQSAKGEILWHDWEKPQIVIGSELISIQTLSKASQTLFGATYKTNRNV
jgi:hypothetical protein